MSHRLRVPPGETQHAVRHRKERATLARLLPGWPCPLGERLHCAPQVSIRDIPVILLHIRPGR